MNGIVYQNTFILWRVGINIIYNKNISKLFVVIIIRIILSEKLFCSFNKLECTVLSDTVTIIT